MVPRICEFFRESATMIQVFAASASTFSRSWQAPPPLIAHRSLSTLSPFRSMPWDMDGSLTHPHRQWSRRAWGTGLYRPVSSPL